MLQYLPWLIAGTAVAALVAVLLWPLWQARRQPPGPPPLPVDWDLVPRPVFTADERRVYRQLREALPHHIVLAKLPLVRLCQPEDPKAVRYWFGLLGAINVTYAVCSANGRVLAAIDLSYDNGGPPSRSTRIKTAVMGACRVRYLRCPADHLPSIPELQLLVPHGTGASRGPQAASANPPAVPAAPPMAARAPGSRRRERTTLWQDSTVFSDSFFQHDRPGETPTTGHGELRALPELAPDSTGDPVGLTPEVPARAPHAPPPIHH